MTIAQNYQTINASISQIARQAQRNPDEIRLVAVSKTVPWALAADAYAAGCRDFGENKVQEMLPKISEAPADVRWHLMGTLQKNKVNKVIGSVSLIHSVDTPELAAKIAQASEQRGMTTHILLQVNTSSEESKHGLSISQWREKFPQLAASKGIVVDGLMTMAPLSDNPNIIRQCFRELRLFRNELGLRELSMGMTQDYPIAIEEGATLLRVGSAIFGER